MKSAGRSGGCSLIIEQGSWSKRLQLRLIPGLNEGVARGVQLPRPSLGTGSVLVLTARGNS